MKAIIIILFLFVFNPVNSLRAQWVETNGPGAQVQALASSSNYLFAGTWTAGVFRTTNFGNNWFNCGLGAAAPILALASNGNTVFAGSLNSSIHMSTDYGNSWTVSLGPFDVPGNPSINCISVHNGTVYAGKRRAGGDSRAFLYSTNNGQSWVNVSAGIYATEVLSIAVIGSNILAGTLDGQSGVYLSTNSGLNWSPKGLTNVFALEAIGNNLFAGAMSSGVHLSTDFGTSWTFLSSGFPPGARVYRLVSFGNYLFAGTYESGVFLSTNLGQNWTDINSGLGSLRIYSLHIMEPYIFAGTEGTVWKRYLQEITSANNKHSEIPLEFSIYQNYPNPFNPTTKIKFDLPQLNGEGKIPAKLTIYNSLGKEIKSLVNENLSPGNYEYEWNASDNPSGVYFYKLTAGSFSDTKKMVLVK